MSFSHLLFFSFKYESSAGFEYGAYSTRVKTSPTKAKEVTSIADINSVFIAGQTLRAIFLHKLSPRSLCGITHITKNFNFHQKCSQRNPTVFYQSLEKMVGLLLPSPKGKCSLKTMGGTVYGEKKKVSFSYGLYR